MAPMMRFGGLPEAARRSRKRRPPIGFVQGRHGRHVKCLAQEDMTGLGHAWLAPDAGAGLVLTRVKAGKSSRLARIGKACVRLVPGLPAGLAKQIPRFAHLPDFRSRLPEPFAKRAGCRWNDSS